MNLTELSLWSQLSASARVLWIADAVAVVGVLLALLSAFAHFRAARGGRPSSRMGSAAMAAVAGVTVLLGAWSWLRYLEVNHFPSQTMNEVLTMFTLALVASMLVLHYALGLHRKSPGWAILDDVLVLLVLASVVFTHAHVRGLVTAQRDLPPALQSYWFPPHLSALIFSYATLGIAGLVGLVWFTTRFWSGLFQGGFSRRSQWLVLAGLTLVPFAQVVTIPVLLLSGAVFLVLRLLGRLPQRATVAGLEKELDEVSYRAFAVGIPFLTAGLFMGAFWAQEAWANYWGWDSKENTALISWLVYVVYVHLRMLGGYRGEKAMAVLVGGALSIFITFQIFGYLPDSQKSLHRYTDDGVAPQEGQQGPLPTEEQARAPAAAERR